MFFRRDGHWSSEASARRISQVRGGSARWKRCSSCPYAGPRGQQRRGDPGIEAFGSRAPWQSRAAWPLDLSLADSIHWQIQSVNRSVARRLALKVGAAAQAQAEPLSPVKDQPGRSDPTVACGLQQYSGELRLVGSRLQAGTGGRGLILAETLRAN
jgi:hypothetical protein